ncbi:MAG: hypothetical protein RIC55_18360 [Pirellulaceae bacterium]
MTAAQPILPEDSAPQHAAASQTPPRVSRAERLDEQLDRWSERLNPILVKEARQALKSRVVLAMFLLVLVLAWFWSFVGLSIDGPAAPGRLLLAGYVWILAFPLAVAIPFSAFQSLAAEREDGTYDLVAITTLHTRQFLSGRMAVASLQLMIFLSALAPCIAFTYLLRGVDLLLILLLLSHAVWCSLLLTSFSLFLATLAENRQIRVFLSMLLLVVIVIVYFGVSSNVAEWLVRGRQLPYTEIQFWVGQILVLTFAASVFYLLHFASIASIGIASENRSTPVRVVMLAQQALIVGWGAWYALGFEEREALEITLAAGAVYWFVMGALLVGESPHLHQRGRRRLPESLLGRAVLTWLQPGPGSGFVFAVANFVAMLVVLQGLGAMLEFRGNRVTFGPMFRGEMEWTLIALGCHFVIYLGLCRMLIIPLRRIGNIGPALGFVVIFALLMAGTFTPLVLASMLDLSFSEYGWTQAPSIPATLSEIRRQGPFQTRIFFVPIIGVILPAIAALVLLLNLVLVSSEVRRRREATPERVLAERTPR